MEPKTQKTRRRPNPAPVLLAALVLAVFPGCIRSYFEGPLARLEGEEPVSGIHAEVSVERDGTGVPTIVGEGFADLVFAQGYAHAEDRLWQMEVGRRIASGRLAEIAGPEAVPVDRLLRIIGLRRVAAREFELLDPETQTLLLAYAAGVNAYVRKLGSDLPLGFNLVGFAPEPWRPVDSLVMAKLLALNLSFNWESELVRWALLDKLGKRFGEDRVRELFPDNRSDRPAILSEPSARALLERPSLPPLEREATGSTVPAEEILAALDEVRAALGAVGLPGSNSWVVDGAMTASGKPVLANDPHLMPQIPSIWYENRLVDRTSGRWVAGVSIPGIPGVLIGRNDRIAWGLTTSFADVEDLFLEMLDDYVTPHRYLDGDRLRNLEVLEERILVRGGDDVVEEVFLTTRGPLLSRWIPRKGNPLRPYRDFSFAWTGLEPSRTAEAITRLNRARDWNDFLEALRFHATPSQNVVYADVDGNIGYVMMGRIPLRKKGDGTLPVPGWTGEYAWTGTIPFEELPQAKNPPTHLLVTANNRVAPAAYPHWLGQESAAPYRAARIAQMLSAGGRYTAEDFARMQGDLRSLAVPEILPSILEIQGSSDLEKKAIDALRGWDGVLTAGSVGAAIYEVLSWRLTWLTLGDELGKLAPYVVGQGITPIDPSNPFLLHTARLVRGKVSQDPTWAWFDDVRTSEVETARDMLARALTEAVAYLRQQLGSDVAKWQWGQVHAITFQSLLGRQSLAEALFHLSRGPYPIGGDTDTVLQTGFLPAKPYAAMGWVPSYRMVVDMADPAVALVRNTTGQSEDPRSPHYDDQIPAWLDVSPREDDVKARGGGGGAAMKLVPARGGAGAEKKEGAP